MTAKKATASTAKAATPKAPAAKKAANNLDALKPSDDISPASETPASAPKVKKDNRPWHDIAPNKIQRVINL